MLLHFFPSRPISLYMARLFLTRSFAVLAMLVLILMALDLLGESGKILAYPGNGQSEVLTYIGLRMPQIVSRFLPFSVLLGTLITFLALNQNSEIVAMKAAGLSAHQILAPLVLASLLVAAISFAFNERITAPSTARLSAWSDNKFGPIPPDDGLLSNVWTRSGEDVIQAKLVVGTGNATRLQGVTVHRRSNGKLIELINAEKGSYDPVQGWRLTGVTRFDTGSAEERAAPDMMIAPTLTPDRFTLARVDADALSIGQLGDAIDQMKAAGRRTAELEANWWHKISGPLSSILMPLLGAVAAFGLARSGALFVRAVIGMFLGFAYFVADNFGLAMGGLGAYPPLVAAWGPFFLFLLIGETVLIRTEE